MTAQPGIDRIVQALWPATASKNDTLWAIIDCARDARIYPALLASKLEHIPLYAGNLPAALKVASPYLMELAPGYSFTRPFLQQAWGQSWCVFARLEDPRNLRHHLRSFLRVQDESGRTLVFRYYDPRVLRVYLPTCEPAELKAVFGPIRSFLMEGERGETLLDFSFDGRQLKTRRTSLLDAPVTT